MRVEFENNYMWRHALAILLAAEGKHNRFYRLLLAAHIVGRSSLVQHWKQMLNYLDTHCGDRMREAGVRI
jgi:hypothetical protein